MRKDLYTGGSVDIPKITKGRSFFDLSHSSHIDMNPGILYPIDQVIEIVPGDTFDYSHKLNIRMTNPPKTPTMDQLVFDIYFFYVPNRIVWEKWDNFITDHGTSFYNQLSFTYPTIDVANTNNSSGKLFYSVLDFLGYPSGAEGSAISAYNPSALPARGYYKIWNEYFRYESLQDEILVLTNDTIFPYTAIDPGALGYYGFTDGTRNAYTIYGSTQLAGLALMPVNRLPGYFSRCLPQPTLRDVKILEEINLMSPMLYKGTGGTTLASNGALSLYSGYFEDAATDRITSVKGNLGSSDSNNIRALSQAFALNKFLYLDNLYGKRITEWTYGHFGVNVPDSRVQRPEFLAKQRIYININQLMQSSETTATSPQGNAGGWSQTFHASHDFTKSFVEFGYLFSLGCIRVLNHSFSQGIDKHWSYRTRFDYYLPEFNNVGDQAVYKRELYLGNSADAVFGYQERFAHLKMIPSRVAGFMRPQVSNTLAIWTYTDLYSSQPSLSADWMFEPVANIERTQFFNLSTAPMFILDFVADLKAYRTMPYHSQPGDLTGSW